MTFSQSIKSVFSKYADFSGRATRSEYWYFYLFNFLVVMVYYIALFAMLVSGSRDSSAAGYLSVMFIIYALVMTIPSLAVTVRRLHDTGHSGWWIFLNLIPVIGSIVLFIWFITDSDPDTNEYGDNPKQEYTAEF